MSILTQTAAGHGDGSDACFVHGGRLLLAFGGGAYGGLCACGDRVSGPCAYLSLTLGCAAWELAAGQCPVVSWPNSVEQYTFACGQGCGEPAIWVIQVVVASRPIDLAIGHVE